MFFRLYVCPNEKLQKRFPAIDKNFIYVPKPVSVGQTDVSMSWVYYFSNIYQCTLHMQYNLICALCSKVPAISYLPFNLNSILLIKKYLT